MNPIMPLAISLFLNARSIIIVPWDKQFLKQLKKAIIDAGLGLGVTNEGDRIRLTVPALTEENRRALVKTLNEKMEKTRIILRQVRESVKNLVETAFEAKDISEDDKFRFIKELDEFSAKKNDELKSIRDHKEEDIMEI
jgi:ribosome recycling factor